MGRYAWLAALAWSGAWPLAARADDPQEVAKEVPPQALLRTVVLERSIRQVPLDDVLTFFRNKHNVRVEVDRPGLEKRGGPAAGGRRIDLPKAAAPVGLLLEMTANRVGGTLRWEAERLRIVAGKPRNLSVFLSPPGQPLRAKLERPAALEKTIENAPVGDILEYYSDRYELTILLDDHALPKWQGRAAAEKPMRLAAGTRPLQKWLEEVAEKVGGELRVHEELLLIAPRSRDES